MNQFHLFCIVLYRNLSVFSQLSLEARGIATKGMQHGLLGGMVHMIQDKDAELILWSSDRLARFIYFALC